MFFIYYHLKKNNCKKMEGRIGRAFTDNLYLVESIPPENEEDYTRKYSVMGSTGNVYKVTIENEPTCTCPDFRIRRNRCKHIFFILIRVMKVDNETQDFYDDEELAEMFNNIPRITHNLIANKKLRKKYQKIKKGDLGDDEDEEEEEDEQEDFVEQKPIEPDDDCPICLDKLKDRDVDYCKKSCGRSIHKLCFKMWYKKNQPICVFCRAEWSFSQLKSSKRKSRTKSKSTSKSRSNSRSKSKSRSRSKSKKQKKKGYINLLYNI